MPKFWKIRYGDNDYREHNQPKWKWVLDKNSRKVTLFPGKEKARQYIRNHLQYNDRTEIVEEIIE